MHFFFSATSLQVMIIVTELGDKTFFIAAIMAMRYARSTVFLGAISALAVMTVLSAALGFSPKTAVSLIFDAVSKLLHIHNSSLYFTHTLTCTTAKSDAFH